MTSSTSPVHPVEQVGAHRVADDLEQHCAVVPGLDLTPHRAPFGQRQVLQDERDVRRVQLVDLAPQCAFLLAQRQLMLQFVARAGAAIWPTRVRPTGGWDAARIWSSASGGFGRVGLC